MRPKIGRIRLNGSNGFSVLFCPLRSQRGKISQIDVLRGLEPKYKEILEGRGFRGVGFSKKFLKTMLKDYVLFDSPLHDICRKASAWHVRDFMVAPADNELIEATATLGQAAHQIVMGHHPLWSTAGSKFAQAEALRRLILPVLCRHADLYLAGHEHTLELHLDDCSKGLPGVDVPPLPTVVSGAGAKQRPLHRPFAAWQGATNNELTTLHATGMVWGFAHVLLRSDEAEIRLVTTPNDASGRPIEEFAYTVTRRSGHQSEAQQP